MIKQCDIPDFRKNMILEPHKKPNPIPAEPNLTSIMLLTKSTNITLAGFWKQR